MSNSRVPEGISMADLTILLEEAKDINTETSSDDDANYDGLTQDQVEQLCTDSLIQLQTSCNHPVAAKVMGLMILRNFVNWHTSVGQLSLEQNDLEAAVEWLRDAGKAQSAYSDLLEIIVPGDFTFTEE